MTPIEVSLVNMPPHGFWAWYSVIEHVVSVLGQLLIGIAGVWIAGVAARWQRNAAKIKLLQDERHRYEKCYELLWDGRKLILNEDNQGLKKLEEASLYADKYMPKEIVNLANDMFDKSSRIVRARKKYDRAVSGEKIPDIDQVVKGESELHKYFSHISLNDYFRKYLVIDSRFRGDDGKG